MRKTITTMAAVLALVVPVLGIASPASAGPVRQADLLTLPEVAAIYPPLADGERIRGRYGVVAPRFVRRDGRLHCDRYRTFSGASSRSAYSFSTRRRTPAVSQDVVRFRTRAHARALLRHYRRYVRTCEGTHRTTDGEGGRARMRVRAWDAPRVGAGSVGLLVAFIQHGDKTWRRYVVARTRRTVSVQEVEPHRGKGNPDRAVELSRKAIRKLR